MTYATADERFLLGLINNSRGQHGLDRLYLERHLNLAADRHTAWMLQTDTFSHTGVNASAPSDRMRSAGFDMSRSWSVGENIAYVSIDGDGSLIDEIQQLHINLMNSPSHRERLLSATYDLVGLGLQIGHFVVDGRGYNLLMLTEDFGATDGLVEYDLAPGISISTAAAPDLAVATPARAVWMPLFDGLVYRQGAGTLLLEGTGRSDDFRLGAAADRVQGASGHDWIAGGGGSDLLRGGRGNDFISGQAGADTLNGEDGEDRLSGSGGNDEMVGGGGADHLSGDSGHDRLMGQAGADRLAGGDGRDLLRGHAGADRLQGDAGDDQLFGGTEADLLDGGAGNDVLTGDAGADSFIFRGSVGRDRVVDYQPGVDRIMIDDQLITNDLERFVQQDIRKVSGGVLIELDDSQTILIAGNITVQQVADSIFLI